MVVGHGVRLDARGRTACRDRKEPVGARRRPDGAAAWHTATTVRRPGRPGARGPTGEGGTARPVPRTHRPDAHDSAQPPTAGTVAPGGTLHLRPVPHFGPGVLREGRPRCHRPGSRAASVPTPAGRGRVRRLRPRARSRPSVRRSPRTRGVKRSGRCQGTGGTRRRPARPGGGQDGAASARSGPAGLVRWSRRPMPRTGHGPWTATAPGRTGTGRRPASCPRARVPSGSGHMPLSGRDSSGAPIAVSTSRTAS